MRYYQVQYNNKNYGNYQSLKDAKLRVKELVKKHSNLFFATKEIHIVEFSTK